MWSQNMVLWCFMMFYEYLDFRVWKFQSSPPKTSHLIQVDRLWCMFELAAFLCPGESLESAVPGMGWFIYLTNFPNCQLFFRTERYQGLRTFGRVWLLVTGVGMLWHLGLMTRKFTGPGAVNLRWPSDVDEGSYPGLGGSYPVADSQKTSQFLEVSSRKMGNPHHRFP